MTTGEFVQKVIDKFNEELRIKFPLRLQQEVFDQALSKQTLTIWLMKNTIKNMQEISE